MRQSKLGAVAARPWLLLLCLALARAATATETGGFISIDCGFPGTTSYVDDTTTLSYAPDAAFTDGAGENYNISAAHVTPELARIYRDVRSFVDGARNCYTLRSLSVGLKYLLRASFMYGNYDGLNRPPVFDLYIGVNLWKTVNVSDPPDARVVAEAIVVVPDDFVQVCLVNTGSGTPFISGLELRPLKSSIYPQVNATQGLVLLARRNFGPTDSTDIVSAAGYVHTLPTATNLKHWSSFHSGVSIIRYKSIALNGGGLLVVGTRREGNRRTRRVQTRVMPSIFPWVGLLVCSVAAANRQTSTARLPART